MGPMVMSIVMVIVMSGSCRPPSVDAAGQGERPAAVTTGSLSSPDPIGPADPPGLNRVEMGPVGEHTGGRMSALPTLAVIVIP